MTEPTEIYTIGHSSHSIQHLLSLLRQHGITAVADVRSQPYSRRFPQFNRETLAAQLQAAHVAYEFLGRELGARPNNRWCYTAGRVRYDRIATTDDFSAGIGQVLRLAENERVALLCAEKDPLACHRTILIGKHLRERGVRVLHILEDGRLESQEEAEARLLTEHHLGTPTLFDTYEDLVQQAYGLREERIAFRVADAPTRQYGARSAGGRDDTDDEDGED